MAMLIKNKKNVKFALSRLIGLTKTMVDVIYYFLKTPTKEKLPFFQWDWSDQAKEYIFANLPYGINDREPLGRDDINRDYSFVSYPFIKLETDCFGPYIMIEIQSEAGYLMAGRTRYEKLSIEKFLENYPDHSYDYPDDSFIILNKTYKLNNIYLEDLWEQGLINIQDHEQACIQILVELEENIWNFDIDTEVEDEFNIFISKLRD